MDANPQLNCFSVASVGNRIIDETPSFYLSKDILDLGQNRESDSELKNMRSMIIGKIVLVFE